MTGWRSWAASLGDWWYLPASSSGQHHHGETQWEHAQEVLALGISHWRRVPHEKIRHCRQIRRSFLRACLFHDVGKATDSRRHDLAGYAWMLPRDRLAAVLILFHSGRWASPEVREYADIPLISRYWRHPTIRFIGELLQCCDYTAAHGWQKR